MNAETRRRGVALSIALLLLFLHNPHLAGQATVIVDIAGLDPDKGELTRVHGFDGDGRFGTPVAGPMDMDGDNYADFAVAYMRASPLGRLGAGQVDLVFGRGAIGEIIDTSQLQERVLKLAGDVLAEATGSEIWIDDVTGDGLGDLLIGRQNHTPDATEEDPRIGAGALSIVVGGPWLRSFSAGLEYLDLRNPDPSIPILTIVGREALDRFGIWVRTGDVDGDKIPDLIVGADQEDSGGENNSGAAYLIRGGPHLAVSGQIDLRDWTSSLLAGHLMRLRPPAGATGFHLGSTCQIADLDNNDRGEVLVSAALNRAGATISPFGGSGSARGTGGAPGGHVYIAWDHNFPAAPWPTDREIDLSAGLNQNTVIRGGSDNLIFGEETDGGSDLDGNGTGDLFVGDFIADGTASRLRPLSGIGYVFYDAHRLKGLSFNLDNVPAGLTPVRILGPRTGAIGADTAIMADFDGDEIGDLLFGSPHAYPQGRRSAGTVHVLYGQAQRWPSTIDTAPGALPSSTEIRITEIHGARGGVLNDAGDTLCYSVSAGDADGDQVADIVTNEMVGNGLAPGTIDVGNLVVLSGAYVSKPNIRRFPQFSNGQGSSTEVVLINPSSSISAAGSIQFTDDHGMPIDSAILDPGGGAEVVPQGQAELGRFLVPPFGSVIVSTNGEGELLAGAVKVNSNINLGGTVRIEIPGIGLLGMGDAPPITGFVAPVRRSAGNFNAGIAVVNAENREVTLDLELLNQQGNSHSPPIEIEIAAGGHLLKFINELFPAADTASFEGTLVGRVDEGSIAVVAVELGVRTGHLIALPVTALAEE